MKGRKSNPTTQPTLEINSQLGQGTQVKVRWEEKSQTKDMEGRA
jgi:hypothetical protein